MRSPALVALLFGSFACTSAPQAPVTGDPEVPRLLEATGGIGTFRPNPAFHPITPPPATFAVRRQSLRAEGEIIVLDGADPGLVANDGMGNYGITDDNQVAIVQAVLAQYPDNFDTIQIYLSFLDNAHAGSAYYQGISNEVSGIGRMVFNGRGGWGLPDQGRLSGFSNMNTLEQFDGLSQAGRVRSPYHAVIAQELTHRWLFFFEFNNAAGRSKALLGRDEAHWSRLAQASGSVQDGNRWMEIDDHNFLMQGHDDNLAPLDLYGQPANRFVAGFLGQPTPGAPNAAASNGGGSGLFDVVAFSRGSGPFRNAFSLELSGASAGQEIRYELVLPSAKSNASELTAASPRYTAPIPVAASVIVKAAVFSADGTQRGAVRTAYYSKLGASLFNFSSHLPVMVIDSLGTGDLQKDGIDHESWIYTYAPRSNNAPNFNASPGLISPLTTTVRGASSVKSSLSQ